MKVFDELSPGANWAPTCCPIAVVLRQASRRRVFPKLDRDRLFSDFSALETARLTLRSLAPEDAEDVFRLLSDPLVAQHQEWDPLGSIADATRFLSERLDLFQRRLRMHWGLALKREGFLVGQVGMHSMSFRDRRAELAFDLRSDYWHQGLMTEAVAAVLSFAFGKCEFNKVTAQTVTDNHAACSLLLRLGFRREGCLRGHYYWKERFHDVELFALHRIDSHRQD